MGEVMGHGGGDGWQGNNMKLDTSALDEVYERWARHNWQTEAGSDVCAVCSLMGHPTCML